jgi:hypothetical protein
LLGFAGICWDLLGFAGICWDLLGFSPNCRIFIFFNIFQKPTDLGKSFSKADRLGKIFSNPRLIWKFGFQSAIWINKISAYLRNLAMSLPNPQTLFGQQQVRNVDTNIYTEPNVKVRVSRGLPLSSPQMANILWDKEIKSKIDFLKKCFQTCSKFIRGNQIPEADKWFSASERGCRHFQIFCETIVKNEIELVKQHRGKINRNLVGNLINQLKRKMADLVNSFLQAYNDASREIKDVRQTYYEGLGKRFETLAMELRPIDKYKMGGYTAIVGHRGQQFRQLPVYLYKKIKVEDEEFWSFLNPTLYKKKTGKMKSESKILGGSANTVDIMSGVRNMRLEQKRANDGDDDL